ncbi:FAD-dependent oxidoreductase [Fulvimonas soli]|uniref:Succinate dehydrogenase/fumarate reductase flavoprotein subunit n=1 Tax=Fulvimonas soli TaxID=155197 RepID=A0A316IEQ0_9GAMM|nr:FAD-dependent oxidoreductase [Fulvimonas soli]PWK91902.1 succinate dehydrogenase/fumarate reductase flavoprotein subunit [Fulvimonas soli]TNY26029.1 hypothetical protein BV497_10770 [Fulvimonas soli]
MTQLSDFDVVVVGSGAGGLSAATTAALHGLKVLVIEKTALFGGSTAISGGTVWIPNNTLMEGVGLHDSRASAMRYLALTVGEGMRRELIEAYVDNGAAMLRFMHRHTAVRLASRAVAPDYYPDKEGWMPGGRALDPEPFDGRRLGPWFAWLRPPLHSFVALGGMMVNRRDIDHLMHMASSWPSFVHGSRLLFRYLGDRLRYPRGTRLVLGNALAASLLRSALDAGVTLWRHTRARELLVENGEVVGLQAEREGRPVTLRSRLGVVLASGGFGANAELRRRYVWPDAKHLSMAPEGNVGEGLDMAASVGASIVESNLDNAFLTPVSRMPDRPGGKQYPHLLMDRAKPGLIAVNAQGRRFVNEATNYHEFGRAMHRQSLAEAHLVVDSRFIRKYGLGLVRPGRFRPLGGFLRSGYLKKAGTLDELAALVGVPADALAEEVARQNRFAASGIDEDFGKGRSAYEHYLGDAGHRPNPCLGPIATPPFYAVTVHPGDIGTSRGLRTNERAQVLDRGGRAIPGLYACGSDMNSIMAGNYPGAGITLGPAMTFGYLIGKALAERAGAEALP